LVAKKLKNTKFENATNEINDCGGFIKPSDKLIWALLIMILVFGIPEPNLSFLNLNVSTLKK